MHKTLTLPLLCLTLWSPTNQDTEDLISAQKNMIAVLSGHQELKVDARLTDRSAAKNRELTRQYLSELIINIGLKPQLQEYKMPNLNPLIDILFDPYRGANVYAVLPATIITDEYVIMGAHFDTERKCPGAIDNASGSVLAFSAFKKLSKLKERNMNIILVFFDQEEEELVGSGAFARYCEKQGYNIHSVHTFDTIGWDNDGDRAVELELPTKDLENSYRIQAAKLDIPIYVTRVNSTDHQSFRALGYQAVGLTDEFVNGDYAPYKDTPKDTYETVNFEFIASCTELVYQTIKEIVNQ